MKGYLKSRDIKKLLCVKQYDLDNLISRRKKLRPLQVTKNPHPVRANRHYTQEDLRQLGKLFYGDIYTKVFMVKCPFCNKPMQTSLSDIVMKQLEGKDVNKK